MTHIQLLQGKYFVGDENHIVSTLLGSCISIVLWHKQRKIGAISHCLLNTRKPLSHQILDSKYCDEALIIMINELNKLGIFIEECEVQLYGGASLNPYLKNSKIGYNNVVSVLEAIKKYNVTITKSQLYGNQHRNILFNIENGTVICS